MKLIENVHTEGLIAAPFTPMKPDGDINLSQVEKQVEFLFRNGVVGGFIGGTTGESLSLTVQERLNLAQRWVETAPRGFKTFIHVGHNSLPVCKTLARFAQKIGASAIAAMGPVFFKPASLENLVDYCAAIAASAPELPFYYYHIPCMTGAHFPMIEFFQAAEGKIPNLAGLKFTDSDFMDLQACMLYAGSRYDVLFGHDEMLLSSLVLGVRGAVGATYNIAAPLYQELIKSFKSGELETARKLQLQSVELVRILAGFANGFLPCAKSIMSLLGVDCGPVRPPLQNLVKEQVEQLRQTLDGIGFFSYCNR